MSKITGIKTSPESTSAVAKESLDTLLIGSFDLPTGVIVMYPADLKIGGNPLHSIPQDMMLCDGSELNTFQYESLHAVISNNFGGSSYNPAPAGTSPILGIHTNHPNTTTTFNLPNFKSGNRIPLGASPIGLNPQIQNVGQFGGSFKHNHIADNHVHTFSHYHTMGNHTHTTDHYHTMGNHKHTVNHTHTQNNHTHEMPPHYHTTNNLSFSGSDHGHQLLEWTTAYSGYSHPQPSSGSWTSSEYNNNTGDSKAMTSNSVSHTVTVTGTVGSGTNADTNTLTSGAPSDNGMTSYTGTSGEPSTNNTSDSTGTTSTISTNNTSTSTTNTGEVSNQTLTTSDSMIPFLTVNFFIQVK